MAKTNIPNRDLDSYTIRGTREVIKPGDTVLLKPDDSSQSPYVALVEGLEAASEDNVNVHVNWYYRPEETKGGKRPFHGSKELFLSDHADTVSCHSILGKCVVHSFNKFTKLRSVGDHEYFSRHNYKAVTGEFTPDRIAFYCKCEMPYNPDDFMVGCEGCNDWFHPSCLLMSNEEVKRLDRFFCPDCSSPRRRRGRSTNSFQASSSSSSVDRNLKSKRRKR